MTRSEGSHRERSEPGGRPPGGGTSLEEILDRYLEELAEGRSPDQEAYLHAHPEQADALRGVFKTLDFVEATSRTLNAAKLDRGQQLGEYRIVREIGRGGMGVVYEAIQTSLNRRVALKVLPAGALLSSSAPERFAREAATAGRLHHTNIVPVYAVGQEQGIHFYAMQYIEGRSLGEQLKSMLDGSTRPDRDYIRRVALWGQQVAEALWHAHQAGTIHRDIKPSNLLLDARDNVWVTDFGLARGDAMTSITITGDVIGTARYMSPEQARGGRTPLDGRTDIYSLGATLYELLALTPAFDGDSREAVLSRIALTEPKPLRQIVPSLPRDLETIVAKCMEKYPERRYARAVDLAEDCRRFAAGEPIRARRTPAVVKVARFLRRHPVHTTGVLIAVVLLGTTLGMVLKIRHEQGRRTLDEAFTALLFESDSPRAARLLDQAAALGVDAPELYLYRGLIPLLNNQPQLAFEHLNAALRRAPGHMESNLALALAYSRINDFQSRRHVLERSANREIDTALGWLLYGLSLSKFQRSEAIDAFDRAVELSPDFAPAISARAYYRGFRLQTEGARAELDPMLKDYEALVVFRPHSAAAHELRARGWLSAAAYAATQPDLREQREQWLANCRADLDQALALRRPDDSLPLIQSGVYLRYIGDYRGAERAFADAIAADQAALGDTHPALVHKHAMMVYALGDPQAALDEIEPVCAAAPTYYPLLYQRVLMLAELGRLEEARAVGREALRHQQTHVPALSIMTVLMELVGAESEAAMAVRALVEQDSGEVTMETVGESTPGPVLDYLLGRLDGEGLLASTRGVPGPRCEYAFLIGLRELARGNRDAALNALQNCVDAHIFRFVDHRFAQIMLDRARSDPGWPHWLLDRDKSRETTEPP